MNAEIIVTDVFKRRFKDIKKKKNFIKIVDDLERFSIQIMENPEIGDALIDFSSKVWKARMRSSDMKKGKSKGFRILYFYDKEQDNRVWLLDIYGKHEKDNVSKNHVIELLKRNGLY